MDKRVKVAVVDKAGDNYVDKAWDMAGVGISCG